MREGQRGAAGRTEGGRGQSWKVLGGSGKSWSVFWPHEMRPYGEWGLLLDSR